MKNKLNTTELQHDAKLPIINSSLVGKKLPTKDGGYFKIMTFSDNYYMVRFKGCVPFCCNEKELKACIEAHCL